MELLDTIRVVHAGRKALSPEASYALADHATDDALTPAEVEVLRRLPPAMPIKRIADQLSISGRYPVKSRVKNISSPNRGNDRTHAAMIGLKKPHLACPGA